MWCRYGIEIGWNHLREEASLIQDPYKVAGNETTQAIARHRESIDGFPIFLELSDLVRYLQYTLRTISG